MGLLIATLEKHFTNYRHTFKMAKERENNQEKNISLCFFYAKIQSRWIGVEKHEPCIKI